jgi:error-prone DNA polymerase
MLPRLRPRCFYDLVIEVAIVRPGPIQGDMVHPYLRRRASQEPVVYPNEAVREVLEKTLGVPIFQEQAMRLAIVAAGFTPGEADRLRRAMGAWHRTGQIEPFREKLIDGMKSRGYPKEFAEGVYRQICGFGEYGFPESHAASFALLVYASAWLKHYYPAAFTAALLNSQPMGFYQPAQLVRDAREHGVEVRPADVNYSGWDCTLEGEGLGERAEGFIPSDVGVGGRGECGVDHSAFRIPHSALGSIAHSPTRLVAHPPTRSLRLGLRMISGLSRRYADAIAAARREGVFSSVSDLARRAGLSRSVLERLARADALSSLGIDRRTALWMALEEEEPLPLFQQRSGQQSAVSEEAVSGQQSAVSDQRSAVSDQPSEVEDRRDEPVGSSSFQLANSPTRQLALPPMPLFEQVAADYRATGLSLRAHPFEFLRPELQKQGVLSAAELRTAPDGSPVRVAGLVLLRQRPSTAKGVHFVTLEDETGTVNLIFYPQTWQRWRRVARGAPALWVAGQLQHQHGVLHVVVQRVKGMADALSQLRVQSRDFR